MTNAAIFLPVLLRFEPAAARQDGWGRLTRLTSGFPVTLVNNNDTSLLGTQPNGVNNNGADELQFAPGALDLKGSPRQGHGFNTALFSRETIGQIGTCDSRMFHGPGTNNFDMALLKDIHITESKFVQLRFEFFNVFNHAQFSNPSGSVTNATFGVVTTARTARVGQLALKFMF